MTSRAIDIERAQVILKPGALWALVVAVASFAGSFTWYASRVLHKLDRIEASVSEIKAASTYHASHDIGVEGTAAAVVEARRAWTNTSDTQLRDVVLDAARRHNSELYKPQL